MKKVMTMLIIKIKEYIPLSSAHFVMKKRILKYRNNKKPMISDKGQTKNATNLLSNS
jgi:hypothetical protein